MKLLKAFLVLIFQMWTAVHQGRAIICQRLIAVELDWLWSSKIKIQRTQSSKLKIAD